MFVANRPSSLLVNSNLGATVAIADGSVRFMSNDVLEATLRAMITRDSREVIPKCPADHEKYLDAFKSGGRRAEGEKEEEEVRAKRIVVMMND